ncbi:hypothetical protein V5O48_003392 [Marasmius crinis-equi]|uniref:Zn(2)-C6 fungal-type domain-containing protein n=1 Tax=Marasmius crinis-equi TaxID=585013 RepID=A0ABR3FTE7_9AGAR
MNNAQGPPSIKKQEEAGDDKSNEKREVKPVVKTLNRVPRACNACRKQKMRCEGADNPPCRRCRNTGLECLFEKPSREATLTGEAGLERIRSLETHVVEIRHTQSAILNVLTDIQTHLRGGGPAQHRSPSAYPAFHQQSPNLHSPSVSTPPTAHGHGSDVQPSPAGPSNAYPHSESSMGQPAPQSRLQRPPLPHHHSSFTQGTQMSPAVDYQSSQSTPNPVLPPFSSIQAMGGTHHQGNVSSKRPAPGSSNVTSAASSDDEDEDSGELPASGLVAPWEVLRGLADVASERADKSIDQENGEFNRVRTPTPERQTRPAKRRKLRHKTPRTLAFPDVVTKNIISEMEARELFRMPVFDSNVDTFEALHERSPYAVNCICMVAARVRDGGGKPSDVYKKCLEEVQSISCATLFLPVARVEAVQAMILVSGWAENGWLSGGHAVRMAMELSLHKAWPKLLRRMRGQKSSHKDDHDLVIAARTWFCLYLMSYGNGRPAVLKEDESIKECRLLLQHPLAIEDDMRLVSTVELIQIRERIHNAMAPFDEPVKDSDFEELRKADIQFQKWYATWDQAFSQKYEDVAFYRQSLQIQQLHAEVFHHATALRGINGPEDVQRMPPGQRELALKSIQIARQILEITTTSPAYREGMKYAVQYTHVAATFTASFMLRLARLFPDHCDVYEVKTQIERLARLMNEIPGTRYAITLEVMLKRFQMRSNSLSPKTARGEPVHVGIQGQSVPQRPVQGDGSTHMMRQNSSSQVPYSPAYETFPQGSHHQQHQHMSQYHGQQQQQQYGFPEAEHIWSGFEMTSNEQLPVWISDQTLGGNQFSQHGMESFLLPPEYAHTGQAPQIW